MSEAAALVGALGVLPAFLARSRTGLLAGLALLALAELGLALDEGSIGSLSAATAAAALAALAAVVALAALLLRHPVLLAPALLVAAPLRQRSSLASDLGAELTERGTVDVDAFGQTTVPGLYAAGDVSAAMQQVAGAIADGSRAAAAINDSLLAEAHDIESRIPRRAAVPTG
jgi:hypothetical protein